MLPLNLWTCAMCDWLGQEIGPEGWKPCILTSDTFFTELTSLWLNFKNNDKIHQEEDKREEEDRRKRRKVNNTPWQDRLLFWCSKPGGEQTETKQTKQTEQPEQTESEQIEQTEQTEQTEHTQQTQHEETEVQPRPIQRHHTQTHQISAVLSLASTCTGWRQRAYGLFPWLDATRRILNICKNSASHVLRLTMTFRMFTSK